MKPLIADLHMHSIMSGHAFGTIRELAQDAAKRNMQLIGVTEHGPSIPGTCDPIYFWNFIDAPRELYGVEMLYGSEMNVLAGGKVDLSGKALSGLDYGVVGIHGLCYENEGVLGNTRNVIGCMQCPKVRFVSHPDDNQFPLDYVALVQAAKELDVALEVNNASLRKTWLRPGSYENYRQLLPLCAENGVKIVVNSDSHDPCTVGDFALAQALLEELDFPDELILNNDVQKLKAFLLK